ncbi:MAG: penicillin-binding protein 1A [Methylococcaceae bacterium]|nr:penicillin-binding protein 1A [Methylococcaceae bacterium]
MALLGLIGLTLGALTTYGLYRYLEPQLPDINGLRDFRYQIPMSVYSADGKLIAQFGEKKRTPLAYESTPRKVIQAFLAAEDDRFFDHPGVDYQGLLRAGITLLKTGEKRQGGSTITMQVARNFFLSSEKTFFRKLKEILLAIKIDAELSKQQILELYLNKIYFGHHAYGVAAAAQVYYGKQVDELTLGETAMIAGLPKAPSAFNPIVNPERALVRRDYVLKRMLTLNYIDSRQYDTALKEAVGAKLHTTPLDYDAPYVAEMVRAEMYNQFGEGSYDNGYKVYTTCDTRLQTFADHALRQTVYEYDERHGYRGTNRHIDLKKKRNAAEWDQQLQQVVAGAQQHAGLVETVTDKSADIYLAGGRHETLDWEGARWARKYLSVDAVGAFPRSLKEILKAGDLILLRQDEAGTLRLTQPVGVEGALVAVRPESGAIVAVSGGLDFAESKFNRATQANRQPGSGFKPILYAAALESGFTPASVINDAPLSFYDPSQEGGAWRPQNYSGRFYGPTRLREALVKSRNLVSIRLLKEIGVKKAVDTALRFGFAETELPRSLTLALGSGSASPLRMAQAFAVFANGGFRIEPYLIDRIETQDGQLLFRAAPPIACISCEAEGRRMEHMAQRVLSPQVHYMMNSMLQDVIRRGTATAALQLGRTDLAGKTGTTNEQRDAWFNGYSPALVASAWLGFDSYKPLGDGETGGHAALPMWMAFMREALQGIPETSFAVPDGITTARIDGSSGLLSYPGSGGVTEFFPEDKVPRGYAAPTESADSDSGELQTDEDLPASEGDSESRAAGSESRERPAATPPKAVESLF